MYIFYLDGSADKDYLFNPAVGRRFFTFSAIGIPDQSWKTVFDGVRTFRRHIHSKYGIGQSYELHATEFLSGRGRPSDRYLSDQRRAAIFNSALEWLASFSRDGVRMLNVAMTNEDWAFERLLNRLNVFLKCERQRALLISDEGNEGHYIKMCRQMRAHNPVPSQYGAWSDGRKWKNIPAENILEDPFFKKSEDSNFIQLADFCAFALLRMYRPIPRLTELGIHRSFPILEPICVTEARKGEPFGVIVD